MTVSVVVAKSQVDLARNFAPKISIFSQMYLQFYF